MKRTLLGLLALWFGFLSAQADAAPPAEWRISQSEGRVLLRASGGQEPARVGRVLPAGGALVTGPGARAELLAGAGLWRVGAMAVWQATPGGARVLSGSALVAVPSGAESAVEALGGRVHLGEGTWMLTAVDNEGLKLVCLANAGTLRLAAEDVADKTAKQQILRGGELVFLRPGGLGFSPVVTVFLAELLGTSRLVRGFPDPLPNLKILQQAASVQSDRIAGVSNALVAGAQDASGFQLL
ncbi:MAG: hypothetical protein RL376_705, partial [Verrucomicrobiota bacterium]